MNLDHITKIEDTPHGWYIVHQKDGSAFDVPHDGLDEEDHAAIKAHPGFQKYATGGAVDASTLADATPDQLAAFDAVTATGPVGASPGAEAVSPSDPYADPSSVAAVNPAGIFGAAANAPDLNALSSDGSAGVPFAPGGSSGPALNTINPASGTAYTPQQQKLIDTLESGGVSTEEATATALRIYPGGPTLPPDAASPGNGDTRPALDTSTSIGTAPVPSPDATAPIQVGNGGIDDTNAKLDELERSQAEHSRQAVALAGQNGAQLASFLESRSRDLQDEYDRNADEVAQNDRLAQKAAQDVAEWKYHPSDFFHNPDHANRSMQIASMAAAAGAFGAALTGTTNTAADLISRAVDNDLKESVEANHEGLEGKKGLLQFYESRGHEIQTAWSLKKAVQLDVTAAGIQRLAAQNASPAEQVAQNAIADKLKQEAIVLRQHAVNSANENALKKAQIDALNQQSQAKASTSQLYSDAIKRGVPSWAAAKLIDTPQERAKATVVIPEWRANQDATGKLLLDRNGDPQFGGHARTYLSNDKEKEQAEANSAVKYSRALSGLEAIAQTHPDGSLYFSDRQKAITAINHMIEGDPKATEEVGRLTEGELKLTKEGFADPTSVTDALLGKVAASLHELRREANDRFDTLRSRLVSLE